MRSVEFGLIRQGIGVGLLFALGASACSVQEHAGQISAKEVVSAVAKSDGALILEGLKKCPQIRKNSTAVSQLAKPTVEIAQAFVGNPNYVDSQGNNTHLHAAHVNTEYVVDDNKSVQVYCGPDNQENGVPFKGVMLVSATDPGLILYPNSNRK